MTKAESIIYLHQTIGEKPKDINLFGVVSGGFAEPTVTKGRQLQSSGEALADTELGESIGDHITMSGEDYEIVGITKHTTLNGGIPTVFVSLPDAQRLFRGATVASAVVSQGMPTAPINGLTRDDGVGSARRPAPPPAERGAVDRLREGAVVDRRGVHHRLDRVPLRDGADA